MRYGGSPEAVSQQLEHDSTDPLAAALARLFDVTWTTRAGDKEYFRRSVSLADLARVLPAMLDSATGHQRNMTCRIGF